jgi:hypothetical protein
LRNRNGRIEKKSKRAGGPGFFGRLSIGAGRQASGPASNFG